MSLMCWVPSVKPSPWEAPTSCWWEVLEAEPRTPLSESNPNSQLPSWASCSSQLPLGFQCLRGRRQWDMQVSLSLCSAGRAQRLPAPPGTAGPRHSPRVRSCTAGTPAQTEEARTEWCAKCPRLNQKGSAKAKITKGRRQHLKRFSFPGAAIPLFARDFLSLGLPAPRDEAQIVQAVVHSHRVQMHHLKARSNPSPVPLPAGHKTNLEVSGEQEQLKNKGSQQFQRQWEFGPAGTGLQTDSSGSFTQGNSQEKVPFSSRWLQL